MIVLSYVIKIHVEILTNCVTKGEREKKCIAKVLTPEKE